MKVFVFDEDGVDSGLGRRKGGAGTGLIERWA